MDNITKRIFLFIIPLTFIGAFLVFPKVVFGDANLVEAVNNPERIKLDGGTTRNIIDSLNQAAADEIISMSDSPNFTIEKEAVLAILRKAIRTHILDYVFKEFPKEFAIETIKIGITAGRLIITADPGVIMGEIEKSTVEKAKEIAIGWLLQNEIKTNAGNLETSYVTDRNELEEVFFPYIVLYKPINNTSGEVDIGIYSSKIIKTPRPDGHLWGGGIEELPPFVLYINGIVIKDELGSIKWVEISQFTPIFDQPVPELNFPELGYIESKINSFYSDFNKAMLAVKNAEETIQEISQAAGTFINNTAQSAWGGIKSYLSQFGLFGSALLPSQFGLVQSDGISETTQNNINPSNAELSQEDLDDYLELQDILNNKNKNPQTPASQNVKPLANSTPEPTLPQNEPQQNQPQDQNLPQTQLTSDASSDQSGGSSGGGEYIAYPQLLISEIQIAGVSNEKEEFVELYNPNSQTVDLTGWYIQRKTKDAADFSTFSSKSLFTNKKIPAKGYFLITREGSSFESLAGIITTYPLTEDNTLVLKNPNREITDKVGWGQVQDYETSPASNPPAGKSIGRKWSETGQFYQDTDNNSIDFGIQNPTPKAKNGPPPPPPTDIVAPSVTFNNLASIQTILNFPISFTITDNSTQEISPSGIASYQFQWKQGEGEWQIDAVQEIADAPLTYNSSKDFTALQDETTYYFQVKAKDANNNESVWLPEVPATTKIRTPKTILINEIQTDSVVGTGGTADDWVELYNPYDVDVSLAGWSIQKHSKSDPCSISASFYKKNLSDDAVMPARGFYLIVSTQANNELKAMADMTVGWSLSDNNTIYLVRNQEAITDGEDPDIIDKVGFGLACFPETAPAPNSPEAGSIERRRLGQDTNDNSADFRISAGPTPKSGSPKVYLQDANDYSDCGGNGECNLIINWRSPSQDIEFYQVQYKVNDGNWKDWLPQTTDTQKTFKASSSILTDHIYYFRARAKDLEGNLGNWSQELKIDLSNPVVINEIALFGTNASTSDQWIELYNKSDNPIDLTGWRLRGGRDGYETFTLSLQGTILAKSYIVLEKTDDQVVSDFSASQFFPSMFSSSYGNFYLENEKSRKMDSFYYPSWPGWQESSFVIDGNYYSIERISPYSFGYDYRNWVINDGQKINGYDRNGNPIYGTPGQQNSNYQLYTLLSTGFAEDAVLPKSIDGVTESPYVLTNVITVFPNTTLTIDPGVVVESWGEIYPTPSGLVVQGTLKATGAAEEPIIFTSRSYPEPGGPGSWLGILFTGESVNSELEYVIVQYAGARSTVVYWEDNGFSAGIRVEDSSISLKNSTIETNLYNGLYLINSSSVIDNVIVRDNKYTLYEYTGGRGVRIEGGNPSITNSTIVDNWSGVEINGGSTSFTNSRVAGNSYGLGFYGSDILLATPTIENNVFEQNTYPILMGDFSDPVLGGNQVTDNGFLNGIILSGNIRTNLVLKPDPLYNLPYIIKDNISIYPGVVLTIQPGVTIKFSGSNLTIQGTLKAIGTMDQPIIFTAASDQPMPGQWNGFYFNETSQDSELENVQVSFGAGIRVNQSIISLKNSVVSQNINNGLWLTNSASVIDNVQILDNMMSTYTTIYGKGIFVEGGSPHIINSIVSGNYYGIYKGDWTDPDGNVVAAAPIIENTDYSNNTYPDWPPPPPLPPPPPPPEEPPPETP
jgi:hypothetical protein